MNFITDPRFVALVVGVIVGLVAVLALFKGRAFKFGLKSGDKEVELGVGGEQKETKGIGDINQPKVLNKGTVSNASLDIHIGHDVARDKKEK